MHNDCPMGINETESAEFALDAGRGCGTPPVVLGNQGIEDIVRQVSGDVIQDENEERDLECCQSKWGIIYIDL